MQMQNEHPWLRATFAVDGPNGRDYAPGIARFEFGAFDYKFFDPEARRTRVVTRLIHLESGAIFGDFADRDIAKAAGKLADEVLEYGFASMSDRQRADEFAEVMDVWLAAGIAPVPQYKSQIALWDRIPDRASFKPAAGAIAWPQWEPEKRWPTVHQD